MGRGKNGIHPGNAHAADANEGQDGRWEGKTISSHGPGQNFYENIDKLGIYDIHNTGIPQLNDQRIAAEKAEHRNSLPVNE